jgi:hypothetical protein
MPRRCLSGFCLEPCCYLHPSIDWMPLRWILSLSPYPLLARLRNLRPPKVQRMRLLQSRFSSWLFPLFDRQNTGEHQCWPVTRVPSPLNFFDGLNRPSELAIEIGQGLEPPRKKPLQ